MCVKGKRINCGVGFGLEIPAQYIFYGNEKAIQWTKRTLYGVDGNAQKKVLGCEKQLVISYLCFVFSGLSTIGR